MKAKEVKETLKELVYNWEIVYDDIKYYLRVNGYRLSDITDIRGWDDFHVILEVENQDIGVI